MESSPLHPFVIHIPLALAVLMPLVSLGILVAWWKKWLPARAWYIAIGLQILLAAGAFAAVETGEEEEHRVEEILADEQPLEEHEEGGKRFMWVTFIALGVMVVPAFIPGEKRKQVSAIVATALSLGVAAVAVGVGQSGGKLVYEHGAANAYIDGSGAEVDGEPANDRDDDDHGDEDDDDDD